MVIRATCECGWSAAGGPEVVDDAEQHKCFGPRRRHGLSATYDAGCRCGACRDARTRYQKRWKYEHAAGRDRLVDNDTVRGHLEALLAAGMTRGGIARRAGVSRSTVNQALGFARAQWRGDRMQTGTAAKLLAVRGPGDGLDDDAETFVHKAGAVRRIQALSAIGWRHSDLLEQTGVRTNLVLTQTGQRITWRNHVRIRDAYERLSMTPGPSQVTAARARRRGWLPPLALDEDRIDDPTYRPDATVVRRRQGRASVAKADVLELLELGETVDAIAQRFGVTPAAVDRARYGRST